MAAARIVIDALSPLSHKQLIGDPHNPPPAGLSIAPTWLPDEHKRRLDGYTVLEAYARNVARLLLPAKATAAERREWREYGDPRAFYDRLVASILGDGWAIVVDGADDNLNDIELPPKPTPAAEGADPLEARIAAIRLAAWERDAEAAVDEWAAKVEAQPALQQRQDEIRAWADQAHLASRIHEAEHQAVALGDTVYVLWPQEAGWPTVEVHHPQWYLPEVSDDDRGGYPSAVHLAWEYEETRPDGTTERRVRRLTWRIADLLETRWSDDGWTGVDGEPLNNGAPFLPGQDEKLIDGRLHRRYPWIPADTPDTDLPTTTCLFSNGSWRLADVQAGRVDALSDGNARWDERDLDLRVDFIPVVHLPHTPTGSEHFGEAAILYVAQILDDLAQTDTRIMGGSEFLGAPAVAMSGAAVDPSTDIPLRAGSIYGVGASGRMDTLDLSAGIDRLFELDDRLLDRWLQNLGAPRELMGRVDEATTSGIHLLLKYLPFGQVVGSARLPREPKYRLLPKMAQRLAQVAGALDAGPTPVARLRFGNFMPMNQSEVIGVVATALEAKAISRQTGLRLLVAAGLPIDDAQAELDRIRADDTAAAKDLADATGSEELAAERLGLKLPTAGAGDPVIELP